MRAASARGGWATNGNAQIVTRERPHERSQLIRALLDMPPEGPPPRALVLIPGGLNYFYDRTGQRLAEALTALGFAVDVRPLSELPEQHPRYDWALVVNIAEVMFGYAVTDPVARQQGQITEKDEQRAIRRLRRVRAQCTSMACVQLDAAGTAWFDRAWALYDAVGITDFLDLGLHDQGATLEPERRLRYHFVLNGLTEAERTRLDSPREDHDRPIPWVCVGHLTLDRARLVHRLVREADPQGFVYTPFLAPFTEHGPHLDERQFATVLAHAKYQVWQSHHPHFYLESERFRQSALAGGVPVKVLSSAPPDTPFPFRDFLVDLQNVAMDLRAWNFAEMQERAADEFRALPSLTDSLFVAVAACFPVRYHGR